MSKILIVPDVHGRSFWHKAEELINEVDKVVFLGDYLDPYSYEGITFDMAMEEFHKILKFAESDKVILLVGNHDMHYIRTDFMDCSRMNRLQRQDIHELYMKHLDKFNLIYKIEDKWLCSHAGVYSDWMEMCYFTLETLEDFQQFLKDNNEPSLECLSYYRGGWNRTGSCIWADIRESDRYELLPGFKHIVGHTQLNEEPYITDSVACLDVRKCFILDTETGEIADA